MQRTDDAILVAIISHSLMAESEVEQRAARMLLDAVRNGNSVDGLIASLDASAAADAPLVVTQLRALIDRYGLADADYAGEVAR